MESDGSWVDRYLLPFVRESTLWPVLIVVIGHVVVGVAPLMLLAVRGDGWATALLAALVAGTAAVAIGEQRGGRRPRALTWTLLVTWVVSGLVAVLADGTGLF